MRLQPLRLGTLLRFLLDRLRQLGNRRTQSAGGPLKPGFGLSGGSSTAGQGLPAARSRFRDVHSDSISTHPMQTLNTRSLHSADHRLRDDLFRSG